VNRFEEAYSKPQSSIDLALEIEVFGRNEGVWGYTTPAQVDMLAERLALGPGMRLLDIGAGRGWPGLYLVKTTGCEAVLTDVPVSGLRTAQAGARKRRIRDRCSFLVAAGTALPFRSGVFDACVHTDVL